MKTALVFGGGGFIGSHLVKRLKKEGFWVRSVDLKNPMFSESPADDFILGDLRYPSVVQKAMAAPNQESHKDDKNSFDEVYQLAADMGGAGYIFTGDNDANVMTNSATVNLLTCQYATLFNAKRVFYSSSACVYPEYNQMDPDNPKCEESSAYPAAPDSEYGWEKLFSERIFLAFNRNHNLDVRIARFHNIYGPMGTYKGGKEKAPAAMIRKACQATDNTDIEVWGDGQQTRSFLFIDACIEAVIKLMNSDFKGPVNIGSEEMVSINNLAKIAIEVSGKSLGINNLKGDEFFSKYKFPCPVGVRGRNSDNKLFKEKIGWDVKYDLKEGIKITYQWIKDQDLS